MKRRVTIEKDEPYFVHVGFAHANELLKYRIRKYRGKYVGFKKMKMRPCVATRINKLYRYWGDALK